MGKSYTYPSLTILEALYFCRGDVLTAAKLLECNPATIYCRMQKSEVLKNAQFLISRNRKPDLQLLRQDLLCQEYPSEYQKTRALQLEDELSQKHEKFGLIY
jgi:hypothetical protein